MKIKRTLLLLAAIPIGLGAQGVTVRGVAFDSLHGKPLPGAFVGIAGLSVSAVSDSAGRFTLAGVPRGAHRIVMQHDVLDAIGISAAGARATVTDGREVVIVAVPSFATLWRAACGTPPPGADTGFVFGSVSRGQQPVPRAVVTASWIDLIQDSTNRVRQKQKTLEIDADSTGNYALCGVPTSTGISVRANVENFYGTWLDVAPLDQERIARRDLTIVSVSDVVVKSAMFVGRVRADSSSQALADAEVSLPEIGLRAVTNARGEFRIGDVIPGTHTVQVRKIGYASIDARVYFMAGELTDRTMVLERITLLDSVAVVDEGNDERMRVFDEHRRIGLGKFLARGDLEKQHNRHLGEMLAQFPAINVVRGPQGQAWLLSNNRGVKSLSGVVRVNGRLEPCLPLREDTDDRGSSPPCTNACVPRIYVDGVNLTSSGIAPNINRYVAQQLEGVEWYAGGAQLPDEYNTLNSACGVLVLHTRRFKKVVE